MPVPFKPRPAEPRMVARFTLTSWPLGLDHQTLADNLERIAKSVRSGFYSGDVFSEGNAGGHWDTTATGDV